MRKNHFYIVKKKSFKIFSRTGRPISIKLDTNHPCMEGIQVCSNKRPVEIITKNAEIG
jgi:hypothetical protein